MIVAFQNPGFCQPAPSPTLQNQASQFSIFEKIAIVELSVAGRTSPRIPIGDRLDALEQNVSGRGVTHPDQDINRRINALIENVHPSNELLEDIAQDAQTKPDWSKAKASASEWLVTPFQIVSALEIEVFGRVSDALMIDRIVALEKVLVPADKQNTEQLTIAQRIEQLLAVISPSVEKWNIARKKAGLSGVDVSFLRKFGKGVKKHAAKSAEAGKKVLQSPTFWGLLIGSAAMVGLVYAAKASSNNDYDGDPEHGCHGDSDCKVCKNCRYCFHCNATMKAPCGVLIKRRLMGISN